MTKDETVEACLVAHSQEIARLRSALQNIEAMALGDGLDYCRSVTEPWPMTRNEMIHHVPIIRGAFMGIAHIARFALSSPA